MIGFLQKVLGDPNEKEIARLQPIVDRINAREEELQALSEEEMLAKFPAFREQIAAHVAKQKTYVEELEAKMYDDAAVLDPFLKKELKGKHEDALTKLDAMYQDILTEMLPEVFATIKNACRRLVGTQWEVRGKTETWNIIPFDVQLIGGIVLHNGKIAEMRTGEGKTFVASLPLILNALTGRGVHLVTVNEYLAQRDLEWMGHLYGYLGLSHGVVLSGMGLEQKRTAYLADITYGTNNEFGFDYLRDNMAVDPTQQVQRSQYFAIVDEVDSILIDEARTPLIISAPAQESTDKYSMYAGLVARLTEGKHYNIDEKQKTASLTEEGIAQMESFMGVENIYTQAGFAEVHHMEQALKARACYRRDIDYVVKDGEVMIVDEFTGRILDGRRYSQGLHQAIEAKEGVEVKRESMTLATVTFQNLFRMYSKLGGMTGTAITEAEEFGKIYKLEVVSIPTNRPIARVDKSDAIFASEKGKFQAVVRSVAEKHAVGQPTLIGTISIEKSEVLSDLLTQAGIPHKVLNAKHHEEEANIVAEAGKHGAVTIATNMAGRGTDIKIDEEAKKAGGLCIIGTERHESRRIDNQLRGRSGRQGDPGESQFYVSMEDDLMRIFGGDRMKSIMQTLQVPEDMPIENGIITKQIEAAQKKVENYHYDIRENVVKYDDVMNKHREIIYARRNRILHHTNLRSEVMELIKDMARSLVLTHTSTSDILDWNRKEILETLLTYTHAGAELPTIEQLDDMSDREEMIDFATEYLVSNYDRREHEIGDYDTMRRLERSVFLRSIDVLWMEHLENMQYLRSSVSLRGYGQRDPLVEYKSEAFTMFETLLSSIAGNVVETMFRLDLNQFRQQTSPEAISEAPDMPAAQETNAAEVEKGLYESDIRMADVQEKQVQVISAGTAGLSYKNDAEKVGRNDPCPCGSGKKYKACHGR
ncbi:preprotein translocase subunit SecA [Candidatus Gracilibacteria bacterium CG17_big_fil_post_rev_8_21_14_2_50_48_13]|nr:MAG: preprotein translocase subunit SecA [Candidatus Gracilibacteria bacterium CG17_big_fil_post_rev_8_21_14_2_50_48_13]